MLVNYLFDTGEILQFWSQSSNDYKAVRLRSTYSFYIHSIKAKYKLTIITFDATISSLKVFKGTMLKSLNKGYTYGKAFVVCKTGIFGYWISIKNFLHNAYLRAAT